MEAVKEDSGKAYVHFLKCIKAIEACPNLAVGDMLWKVAYEILPGGYEYVVCRRKGDHAVIKFRVDHLADCFEVVDVPVEDDFLKISELMANDQTGTTTTWSSHVRRY